MTEPAKIGDVLDMGAHEPPNAICIESLTWVDYGWGDGPTFCEGADTDDPDANLLEFGKSTSPSRGGEWKFYIGGKSYGDWVTVLRRFGPVRVTRITGGDTE